MRSAVPAALLLLAFSAEPVAAVSLSSAVDARRAEARSGLTAKLGFLVRSLDDFLDDVGISPFLRPQAAHARLLQEVQRLDDDGDALGALLFRDLARQMPLTSLFPLSSWPEQFGVPGNSSASISETMDIHADNDGHLVKTIIHCENGKCSNRTEAMREAPPKLDTAAKASGDLGEAVSGIANDLKHVFDSMGADGLKGLFKDTLGMPGQGPDAPSDVTDGLKGLFTDALGTAGKDAQLPSDLANQVGGALGKVFGDLFKGSNATVTSSTITRVENGKVLQETTRCENGHCVKETHEEDLPAAGAVPSSQGLPDEGAVASMPL